MRRFPTLLVGLSLGPDDPALLAHVAALAPQLGVDRVRILHVVPGARDAALPPDVEAEIDEALQLAVDSLAHLHATAGVVVGGVAMRLLQEAVEWDVDLICLGRGAPGRSPALGTSAGAIVRKAPCSVLVVPRDQEVQLGRVIVPVDFSTSARQALDVAVGIATGEGNGAVLALHAHELPLGWQKGGMSAEEWRARAEEEAADSWQEFSTGLDPAAEVGFRLLHDPVSHLATAPHGRVLCSAIESEGPGLVVTSSRGRTPGAALLLGSVAARLVNSVPSPCLVLKNKGETMGVLQALRII
jgi:nucleotide-binding universal stress UspA family protein